MATQLTNDEIFTLAKAATKYASNPDKWSEYLNTRMRKLGYEYLALPCCCDDGGEYGHEFYCGWGKKESATAEPPAAL